MGFSFLDESTRPKAVDHGQLANSHIRPISDARRYMVNVGFRDFHPSQTAPDEQPLTV